MQVNSSVMAKNIGAKMARSEFKAKRITRTYRQTINGTPDKVFPLLCPVCEAEWLDGWQYEMIYSESGFVEEGAVFSTPHSGEEDTVWVVTKHVQANRKVEFTRFTNNSRTCVLKISVISRDSISSFVDILYTYTAVSAAGNNFIDSFTEEIFLEAVTFWEKSMNYFLETGERLKKA